MNRNYSEEIAKDLLHLYEDLEGLGAVEHMLAGFQFAKSLVDKSKMARAEVDRAKIRRMQQVQFDHDQFLEMNTPLRRITRSQSNIDIERVFTIKRNIITSDSRNPSDVAMQENHELVKNEEVNSKFD